MFRRYESPRTKVMGSAGVLGSLLGAIASGQIMIWVGLFKPGVTPNEQILQYWPGFLAGAVVGGAVCVGLSLSIFSFIHDE